MSARARLARVFRRRSAGGARIGPGSVCAPSSLDGIAPGLITIGADSVIAPRAMILTHDGSLLPSAGKYVVRPVTIGDRVFVGYGAIVMPGVTIGDSAVIGAGAVVTHDVPAGTVAAGVPARVIGTVDALAARHDPEALVEPPFPLTYDPSRAQLRALRERIAEQLGL